MNLDDLKELLQDDLICLLDQFNDNELTSLACQIVIDRINQYMAPPS